MQTPLRIVPLGGLGEVGMNCLALELDDTIVVIDCGVTFPDDEPGVDVIHPDFSYLLERKHKLKAIVITHGHEDHIGALPYLLADVNVPVYGPAYALSLVRERLAEFDLETPPELITIKPRQRIELGAFAMESFRVTHSIPDSTGLALYTRLGTLVHSGDFKIDLAPPDAQEFDFPFLEELAGSAQGVRLLFSDSTNVDVEGFSGGEAAVAVALERHIKAATGRTVVSMFGSNSYRVAAVLRVARELGKQVLLLGRSLMTHARIAEQLGLLPKPLPTYISPDLAQTVAREKLLVLASGSQAEPQAALFRIAKRTHHQLKLDPGDTVLLSSRIIPGHERGVHSLVDDLERQGVRVLQRFDDAQLHCSGHACREEQRKLISVVKPRTFVPVHGTFHHLRRHAELAREMHVPDVALIENGAVLELDDEGTRVTSPTETGRVHVQAGGALDDVVLRDRTLLSQVGIVLLTLFVDADGALREAPHVLTRGVLWEDGERALLSRVANEVHRVLERLPLPAADEQLRELACKTARNILRNELGFRPLTHCVIVPHTQSGAASQVGRDA